MHYGRFVTQVHSELLQLDFMYCTSVCAGIAAVRPSEQSRAKERRGARSVSKSVRSSAELPLGHTECRSHSTGWDRNG